MPTGRGDNYLSTHDLTRRSTTSPGFLPGQHRPFNSRPHTEVDLYRLQLKREFRPFNSRPHTEVDIVPSALSITAFFFQLTTSHGGRPYHHGQAHVFQPFNSRPHTEVDLSRLFLSDLPSSFNSRPHTEVDGVRPTRAVCSRTFNSRPHTEVDFRTMPRQPMPLSFNSRPHTEVDPDLQSFGWKTLSFNSRPHTEVDNGWKCSRDERLHLSTHDLTRRSTGQRLKWEE